MEKGRTEAQTQVVICEAELYHWQQLESARASPPVSKVEVRNKG